MHIDAYVLCRVFFKQNNTGSRYAPFLEEEWDDDNGERVAIHVPDDGPLPLCVLNKEAPLPLIQYKRKRRISSSQTTQDHRSFTETIIDSTASAEPLDISERIALRALNGMLDDLEKEQEPVVVDGNKINEIQQVFASSFSVFLTLCFASLLCFFR